MNKAVLSTLFIFLSLMLTLTAVADQINACSLITKKEAQKAVDVKLSDGTFTDMFEASGSAIMKGKTLCHFESLDKKHYKRFVSVDLSLKETQADAAQAFDDLTALIQSPEPVKGIGEKAIWGGISTTPFGGLHVLNGKYYIIIKLDAGKEKKSFNQAKKLAKIAIGRL